MCLIWDGKNTQSQENMVWWVSCQGTKGENMLCSRCFKTRYPEAVVVDKPDLWGGHTGHVYGFTKTPYQVSTLSTRRRWSHLILLSCMQRSHMLWLWAFYVFKNTPSHVTPPWHGVCLKTQSVQSTEQQAVSSQSRHLSSHHYLPQCPLPPLQWITAMWHKLPCSRSVLRDAGEKKGH